MMEKWINGVFGSVRIRELTACLPNELVRAIFFFLLKYKDQSLLLDFVYICVDNCKYLLVAKIGRNRIH